MASILDRYGIKEVADVTFYKINSDGTPGAPVLFLDTLKVSTIEQTAEQVDARGGKGNPKLITWDYGKEITLTLEDALFSPKSMAIMLGDGTVAQGTAGYIRKTGVVRLGNTVGTGASAKVKFLNDYITVDVYDANEGSKRVKLYLGNGDAPAGEVAFTNQLAFLVNGETAKLYDEDGTVLENALTMAKLKSYYTTGITPNENQILDGHKVMFTYWVKATTKTITVSGDTFPGTYYIQGDTYSRSDVDGRDQFFQFIVPKAKLTAEQTITLEAEGDPSTFNMNLTVLRPESGEMMKLVQYDLEVPVGTDDGSAG
jgi:hypothetical protein